MSHLAHELYLEQQEEERLAAEADEKKLLWHVIAYNKKCDIIFEDYCFSNEEAEGLKKEHLLDIGDPEKSTEHVEIRRVNND